jgi:ABC-type multidrug transport system fused ATPase/permease subunit
LKTIKKIIDLLTPKERKALFPLFIITLVMALLDVFGVASILPFVAVLSNSELIESNHILSAIYQASNQIGIDSKNKFIFCLGLFTFFMLFFSLAFKTFASYSLLQYGLMREYSLSKRLLEKYIGQPYEWFLNRNSAELGKNILSEVGRFTNYCLIPILHIFSQSIVVIALITLIIIINPIIALVTFAILCFGYFVIFKLTNLILKNLGKKNTVANANRFSWLQEAFGAIKELKIRGLEPNYVNRYSLSAITYAKTLALFQIIGQLPKYFMEAIAFGGVVILILILLKINVDFFSILPIITVYVLSGYKIMPALQLIYNSYTQLRFANSSLNLLHNDIINLKAVEPKNLDAVLLKKSIKLKNIHFSYPNSTRFALKDISIDISAKSMVAFVGSTGSGKTTIVDIILGLLEPQHGTLMVDGMVIDSSNRHQWQKNIGYVPQSIYLIDGTVSSNIAIGVESEDINQTSVERAAKIARLHDFVIKELPNGYKTTVGERGVRLSGGQRQRIGIARALYNNPELLVFDEATSALDNLTERAVMEEIKNIGKEITIIIIAHRLNTILECDNIFLLEKGELKGQGNFETLIQTNEKFRLIAEKKYYKKYGLT